MINIITKLSNTKDLLDKILNILGKYNNEVPLEILQEYDSGDLCNLYEKVNSADLLTCIIYNALNEQMPISINRFCVILRDIIYYLYDIVKSAEMPGDYENYFGIHAIGDNYMWVVLMDHFIRLYSEKLFPSFQLDIMVLEAFRQGYETLRVTALIISTENRDKMESIDEKGMIYFPYNDKKIYIYSRENKRKLFLPPSGIEIHELFDSEIVYDVDTLFNDNNFQQIGWFKTGYENDNIPEYNCFKTHLDYLVNLVIKISQRKIENVSPEALFNQLINHFEIDRLLPTSIEFKKAV